MSLSIPNRKQTFARSNHAREPRQSEHTSKRLQRRAKHVKLSGVDYFDATAKSPAEEDSPHPPEVPLPNSKEVGEYKCDHCQEDFLIDHALVSCCQEVLPTCAAHFLCNSCINTVFEKAMMSNWQYFPARCCPSRDGLRGIDIDYCLDRLDRDNWDPGMVSQYQGKLKEYLVMKSTPDLYVLCAVADCGKWQHPSDFQDAFMSSVAKCSVAWCHECGTWTCVSCKSAWEDGYHRCDSSEDPSRKPSWLPEYSDKCRIKPCPKCHLWIELHEACNHMTCEHCRHQFCFVCMMTWDGGHNGCPQYGDRAGGYDASSERVRSGGSCRCPRACNDLRFEQQLFRSLVLGRVRQCREQLVSTETKRISFISVSMHSREN